MPVIMGGSHVSFLPDEALEHADFIIRGEGEVPFQHFMKAFDKGGGWEHVPNLSFRKNGEIIHNPALEQKTCLTDIPFPDFSTVRKSRRFFGLKIVPVETSRGCPYNCEFCTVNRVFGRKMRYRPIPELVEYLKNQAGKRDIVFFVDDNFTANPRHTKKLLKTMLDNNVRLNWTAQVRMDSARDPELLDMMRETGCQAVYTGIETINEQTLLAVNKKQTVKEVSDGVAAYRSHGIKVHGMFIFGFDNDDMPLAKNTVKFAKKIGLNTVQFLILTPLPGTRVFDAMDADQRLLTREWHYYDAHHVVFRPSSLLPYELQRMQIKAHQKFYSLGRQLKHLMNFNFFDLAISLYANHISVRWKSLNRVFLKWLKRLGKSLPRKPSVDVR
jgi:radical SAM superfamily enzyme YgiQ (UPF0313 family)